MKPIAVLLTILFIGTVLMISYSGVPRMLNSDWQSAVVERDSSSYFREYDKNVNPKALIADFGLGLVSLGVSLLSLLVVTKSWTVARLKTLRTPAQRWMVYVAANVAWWSYIHAEMYFLEVQQGRDEFAPWADSISIPMMGLGAFFLVGLPIINVGIAIYLYRAVLPAPMWGRPSTVRSWVLNVGAAGAVLACAWACYDAVIQGDALAIPAIVAVAYLLLVGRAAASTRQTP